MKLILSPNDWLQKKVKEFDFNELNAEELSKQMHEVMAQHSGIGLSANQVGIDAQLFVMKTHLTDDRQPLTIINPEIEAVAVNMQVEKEGCLSHPNLFLPIKRSRGIKIKYLDIYGKECNNELYDIDARCFLHEYDHLQGIEFVDRVSKLKVSMAKKKLAKMKKKDKVW